MKSYNDFIKVIEWIDYLEENEEEFAMVISIANTKSIEGYYSLEDMDDFLYFKRMQEETSDEYDDEDIYDHSVDNFTYTW